MTADHQRVLLRNGTGARIVNTRATGTVFTQIGYADGQPNKPELWTAEGYWTEHKTEHPMDIVGIYMEGKLFHILREAATAKGSA